MSRPDEVRRHRRAHVAQPGEPDCQQSVALDLAAAGGLAAARALIERADVLIENLRPGAMDQLGLGYDELRQRSPRLIYASATGWGRTGPLARQAGLDIMAQARSGLM